MEPATQWPWWTRVRALIQQLVSLVRLASYAEEKHTRRDRGKIAGGDRADAAAALSPQELGERHRQTPAEPPEKPALPQPWDWRCG